MIVLPIGIAFIDWSEQLIMNFPADDIPRIDNPEEWKDWAQRVLLSPSFLTAPQPEHYGDWQEWAFDVIKAVG